MRHLLSHTVYDDPAVLGDDPRATLSSIRADGLELLTSYSEPEPYFRGITEAVHLPYATDWLAAWEGRPYDMDADSSLYYMFGRDPSEVVSNVTRAIEAASSLDPAYGVFHAGDGEIPRLVRRTQTLEDGRVLDAFAEMVNEVAAGFPGGEPPFRILFENLWWPGLKLLDASDFRRLERSVEFEDWGFCLDTGHMMNLLPVSTEREGIEALEGIFANYPRDMVDRITTVHFHWSASHPYRSTFEERDPEGDLSEFISGAYGHISSIDQHMPFSDPGCARLLELLDPEYVTHEMPGSLNGVLEDFVQQRSLLP